MSELLDRLRYRLTDAGWSVRDEDRGTRDEHGFVPIRWLLESRRPPEGVRVELRIRLREQHYEDLYYRAAWFDEYLTAVTVRYPMNDADATVGPEPMIVGEDIHRDNYRQLVRILEWFRDPLSGNFWHEPGAAGDWEPPLEWLAQRWGPQATLEYRWPTCLDGQEMLRFMPGKLSDRKMRLIACGCARLLGLPMQHERNQRAVEAAERYAEGECARREAKRACKQSDLPWLLEQEPLPLALTAIRLAGEYQPGKSARLAADVVRDVVGNPFRLVELRYEWVRSLGGAVSHLVDTIVIERRFDELPILADALEDAGCRVQAVLDHCRGGGAHVRGCWVVDLLRAKA